ncbi:MAG: ABC transporter permease [Actinomycetota bacterium]|nr:ABC transporter permease [Actinomycetota bacterium]
MADHTTDVTTDETHEHHTHHPGEREVGALDAVPPGPAGAPAAKGSGPLARAARTARLVGPPAAVFAVILAVWYAISYGVLSEDRRFLLPPPHAVIDQGFLAAEARGEILASLWVSTEVALIGLAIAFVLGSVLAILMSQANWIERSLYPYAVFLQTVPILALVPVMGFWFGFGTTSRITVCVIIALFPLIINPLKGLLDADRGLHDLLTMGGASRWTRLVKLQIPTAMPDVFTGLQTAAGLSVVGAVVGDFYFGRGEIGLGLLLSRYSSRLQSEEMLATVFVACALGIVVFWLFGALGRRSVGRWNEAWGTRSRH